MWRTTVQFSWCEAAYIELFMRGVIREHEWWVLCLLCYWLRMPLHERKLWLGLASYMCLFLTDAHDRDQEARIRRLSLRYTCTHVTVT